MAGRLVPVGWSELAHRTPPLRLSFPNPSLESGIIVGHVTDTSARVWARCPPNRGSHRLIVRQGGHVVRTFPILTSPESDDTGIVDVGGLRPSCTYELNVVDCGGESVLPVGIAAGFRTQPDLGRWERTCFAVVSCHMPYQTGRDGEVRLKPTAAMLRELRIVLEDEGADFVIAMGDQVYADGPSPLDIWSLAGKHLRPTDVEGCRSLYRQVYRGYWGLEEMRRLHARFPHYMIWDDHEIVDDWGSHPIPEGEAGLWASMGQAGRKVYEEYQHAHNPPTAPGVYHYWFDHGPVAFFVMDLRGQRSASQGRLLGDRQWRDLDDWLVRTADRPARFLVSSVPLVHVPDRLVTFATRRTDRPGGRLQLPATLYDRWCSNAFASELERLMSRLLHQPDAIAPVTILAGDIHIAAAFEFCDYRWLPARVQQWITSGITSASSMPMSIASQLLGRMTNVATRWRVHRHFDCRRNNFGIVEVHRTDRARCETAFHAYAWNGRRAERVATVRCRADATTAEVSSSR